jgi:predicted Rossmann fold flavoprotein
MDSSEKYDVIVIGGGASGLMAAGIAAAQGRRVLLLEKNKKLAEKLRISGGHRCNITNAEEDLKTLLAHYGTSEQFLYSSFAQFGVTDTFAFFENLDLPLVVQARKRAFPQTERAEDVCQVLEQYCRAQGVDIRTGSKASMRIEANGTLSGVAVGPKTYEADSYILATGGVSHPETGSTGDGFKWLKALGHSIQDPTPTIVPLKTKESWSKKLSGVTLPNVKVSFYSNDTKTFSRTGDVLLTHFGLSGPLILNSAAQVSDLLHAGTVSILIDLHPTLDLGILDRHLMALFDANKNKQLKNVFKEAVPPGTSESLLALLLEIDPEKKVHSVTKEERRTLAELLKAIPLTVSGLMGYDRAVVADGGVPLEEVDMRTMRSKRAENLFITGDLLHITRPSGGYSLQLCWTTGFVAGMNA